MESDKHVSYRVVLGKLISSTSNVNDWGPTGVVMGPFDDADSAYALAREKNNDIPDQHHSLYRYLVLVNRNEEDV